MKALYNLTFLLLLLTAHPVKSALVEYNLTSLGGSSYQYDYTVSNDGSLGLGVDIEWFAILFDPSIYNEASLTIVTPDPPASDWDQLILGSGLLVPAAYDVFALSAGIAQGDSVFGFAVQFDWLGLGTPGSQSFEVYDATTFDLIYQGSTTTATTTSTVPTPSTLLLLLLSVLGLWLFKVKRRLIG